MEKSITYFKDFLSEDLFKELQGIAIAAIKDPLAGLSRTNNVWDAGIVKESMPVLVKDIDVGSDLYKRLKAEIDAKTGKKAQRIMIYYWTRLSYIPWHGDGHVKSALTLYLNEVWDKDWGGYFMFEGGKNFENTENNVGVVKPSRNCAVLQDGNVEHATTTLNLDADIRMTIQIFFDDEDTSNRLRSGFGSSFDQYLAGD